MRQDPDAQPLENFDRVEDAWTPPNQRLSPPPTFRRQTGSSVHTFSVACSAPFALIVLWQTFWRPSGLVVNRRSLARGPTGRGRNGMGSPLYRRTTKSPLGLTWPASLADSSSESLEGSCLRSSPELFRLGEGPSRSGAFRLVAHLNPCLAPGCPCSSSGFGYRRNAEGIAGRPSATLFPVYLKHVMPGSGAIDNNKV